MSRRRLVGERERDLDRDILLFRPSLPSVSRRLVPRSSLARLSSLLFVFLARLSAFVKARGSSASVAAGPGSSVGLASVIFENPLYNAQSDQKLGSVSTRTYRAAANASASASFIFLISSALSSSAPTSRLYQ
jgi:hypothetical protein